MGHTIVVTVVASALVVVPVGLVSVVDSVVRVVAVVRLVSIVRLIPVINPVVRIVVGALVVVLVRDTVSGVLVRG